ncbi:alpha/beta hydrolase fold domain-containing protein [Solwaraspora sp. WMMD792]|uniref:alpha/beta hydrolase fold domain-containing protein n=1 Tax=Solwaraspora sp. WMMD792 TaxID=3016099 RepID=UPI002415F36C|nr:alpha/beta hydrolase fold domain-containing protein [Solwaraspora sp. WMMD792]MDG4771446.1 alpha/beta hydrolase fold domain-containing protein [Solwaraspora sp. WMMD792]
MVLAPVPGRRRPGPAGGLPAAGRRPGRPAADLAGLPPTYLVTAEHCPLRSENEAYAARLRATGVAVTLASHPGVVHGFFTQWHQLDTGRTATAQAFAVLRAVLDG